MSDLRSYSWADPKDLTGFTPSKADKAAASGGDGSLALKKMPMARIVERLRMLGLGKGLVDETGLAGDFDVELKWTAGDTKALAAALETCGLQVVTEDRPVRRVQLRQLPPAGK